MSNVKYLSKLRVVRETRQTPSQDTIFSQLHINMKNTHRHSKNIFSIQGFSHKKPQRVITLTTCGHHENNNFANIFDIFSQRNILKNRSTNSIYSLLLQFSFQLSQLRKRYYSKGENSLIQLVISRTPASYKEKIQWILIFCILVILSRLRKCCPQVSNIYMHTLNRIWKKNFQRMNLHFNDINCSKRQKRNEIADKQHSVSMRYRCFINKQSFLI